MTNTSFQRSGLHRATVSAGRAGAAVLACLMAWVSWAGVCAAATPPDEAFRYPLVAIPYASHKPVIDGTVDEIEWRGAMSHQALLTTGKKLSARQTRFWMMWDEENLYVAMRDPLRKGERVQQKHRTRERGTDQDVIYDDCYEIWISVGATDPLTGQLNCSTQFVANFAGARHDALHQPAVGNSRTSSYDTDWEPKSRITADNEWEMEVVIPRASLGTTEAPFHDGMVFRALLARNYKRPWEQNSFEGTSTFSVIDTHSRFVMSKTAPALHLLSVGDAASGTIGLRLAAQGQTDTTIHWSYKSDAVSKSGDAQVKRGVYAEIVNQPELDRPGTGSARITVTDAQGRTLLDWSGLRAFGMAKKRVAPAPGEKPQLIEYNPATETLNDSDDVLDLSIAFNPERDYARVFGDFINFARRDQIRSIVVTVTDEKGATVKRVTTGIDALAYARAVIQFESLAPGKYAVRLDCLGPDGAVIASKDSAFEKENLAAKYEWWATKRGSIERVVAPWTPVTRKNATLGVWGRDMEIGTAGLPAKFTTQGKDILAAPGRLLATSADGGSIEAKGAGMETLLDKDHRKIVEVSSALGDIDIKSRVQVEFDGMYKLTMTLTPRQPTTVKDLRIILPYAPSMAEYLHAATSEIRSGYWYGFIPQGKGRVWDSTMLGDKTMKIGSFIPYVWLGSTQGGLCWFADGDEGWTPSDATPAIEVQRNADDHVDLVFNLISGEQTLDRPRVITFALQASPVKPMHAGWREDNWWCGDTFKNYAHDENLIFLSVPFVVPKYAQQARQMVEQQHKGGRAAVPYFIHTQLPGALVPELRVFGEQWKTTGNALCYGGSLNDYMIDNWSKWAEEYGIDGYYIDNMAPLPCDNIEHGCGYRLPDGRVQPTFKIFGTRDYFLRSRALFLEQHPDSRLVLHMTNNMILPWVGPADVAYDGEHHVIYPEMNKDFMDFWSLERMRVDYPGQWGVAVNFMQEYQGQGWDPVKLHQAFRSYFATVMLHDALPTGNHNGQARELLAIRHDFGIGADDVKFLPYWDQTALSAEAKDIKVAGWLRPGKLLLLIANFGESQDAAVTLDFQRLGWAGATIGVNDPETSIQRNGTRFDPKTPEEIQADRAGWDAAETQRIARLTAAFERKSAAVAKAGGPAGPKPDLNPRPYIERPTKRVDVPVFDGTLPPPPRLDGNELRARVDRHGYRLLIVERK